MPCKQQGKTKHQQLQSECGNASALHTGTQWLSHDRRRKRAFCIYEGEENFYFLLRVPDFGSMLLLYVTTPAGIANEKTSIVSGTLLALPLAARETGPGASRCKCGTPVLLRQAGGFGIFWVVVYDTHEIAKKKIR